MFARVREFLRNDWKRFKQTALWRHRTKNLGGLGVVAGATQNFLDTHHIWRMPDAWNGALVGVLGVMVGAVGVYNTLKDYFGWQDET